MTNEPERRGGYIMAYFDDGNDSKILDKQCQQCLFRDKQCPIYLAQGLYNYDQMQAGQGALRQCMVLLVDDGGTCQIKKLLDTECKELAKKKRLLDTYTSLWEQYERSAKRGDYRDNADHVNILMMEV